MGDIKARVNALERTVQPIERMVDAAYYAPGRIGWHAEFVTIVREEYDQFAGHGPLVELDKRRATARRARDEEWGSSHVRFYDQQVEVWERTVEFYRRLCLLAPNNATDLYNLILVYHFRAARLGEIEMLSLYFHIACSKLRLYDYNRPFDHWHGWQHAEYSPRLMAHLEDTP